MHVFLYLFMGSLVMERPALEILGLLNAWFGSDCCCAGMVLFRRS